MEIKSSTALSVSEVHETLLKRKKDGDLGYEQSEAFDYCEKLNKSEAKKAQKLVHDITKQNSKINHELATKIVDIMPKKSDTLKAIVLKDKIELNEEEVNEIFKLLQ
ncbi:hypothetical protein J4450_06085 [Candidatus Micrarchaeota archaeon]|nr:hypothetical protein [Candidatus Micrarchaeota archaeon]